MIIVLSYVICLFVGHFSISVHWEFSVLVCFGCRIVLVLMCVILFKDLFGQHQKIFLEKHSKNPERSVGR